MARSPNHHTVAVLALKVMLSIVYFTMGAKLSASSIHCCTVPLIIQRSVTSVITHKAMVSSGLNNARMSLTHICTELDGMVVW